MESGNMSSMTNFVVGNPLQEMKTRAGVLRGEGDRWIDNGIQKMYKNRYCLVQI